MDWRPMSNEKYFDKDNLILTCEKGHVFVQYPKKDNKGNIIFYTPVKSMTES